MITEDDTDGWTKMLEEAQDPKRVRAAIDEIADKPDAVGSRIKPQQIDQSSERDETPLYVADCIGGHKSRLRFAEPIRSGHQIQGLCVMENRFARTEWSPRRTLGIQCERERDMKGTALPHFTDHVDGSTHPFY